MKIASAKPRTLEACWDLLERVDRRVAAEFKEQRDLLSEEQAADFDKQNDILEEQGEDAIWVAEFLKCRLDDAYEALSRSRVDAQSALDAMVERATALEVENKDLREQLHRLLAGKK